MANGDDIFGGGGEGGSLDQIARLLKQSGAAAQGFDPRSILFGAAKAGIPIKELPNLMQSMGRKPKSGLERIQDEKAQIIESASPSRKAQLLGLEPSIAEKRLAEAQLKSAEAGPAFRAKQLELQQQGVDLQRERLEQSGLEIANNAVRLLAQDKNALEEFEQREDIESFRNFREQADVFSKNLVSLDFDTETSFKLLMNLVATGQATMKDQNGDSFGYMIGDSLVSQLLNFGLQTTNETSQGEINFAIKQLLAIMNKKWKPDMMKSVHQKLLRSMPIKGESLIPEQALEQFEGLGEL